MDAYAGIGAREISSSLKKEFIEIGKLLAQRKTILRSGGADGADLAFEAGCDFCVPRGTKEIFLPWKNFNHNSSSYVLPDPIPEEIVTITSRLYPHWAYVKEPVRRLHARNVMQILGQNLNTPSKFVVCYTERSYDDPSAIGGTLFGIKLAEEYSIPVYNFYIRGVREEFYRKLEGGNI